MTIHPGEHLHGSVDGIREAGPAFQNPRLLELASVADLNRPFFDDFEAFVLSEGWPSLHSFVLEPESDKAKSSLHTYFKRRLRDGVTLHDGVARAYAESKAKWLFLGWLFREAPEQRLKPMIRRMEAATLEARRAAIMNNARLVAKICFPDKESWNWHAVREVLIARLEGSRRAIKGTLIEQVVRGLLSDVLSRNGVRAVVCEKDISLHGETYDVSVSGPAGTVLIPVKTRETMGGGHSLLFTRDIAKAISVAHKEGYACVPIIIAEARGGNLASLAAERTIVLPWNPNQLSLVEPMLRRELEELLPFIRERCTGA